MPPRSGQDEQFSHMACVHGLSTGADAFDPFLTLRAGRTLRPRAISAFAASDPAMDFAARIVA